MKAKVFRFTSAASGETALNQWLSDNPAIDITTIVQSSASEGSTVLTHLTIFYDEPEAPASRYPSST